MKIQQIKTFGTAGPCGRHCAIKASNPLPVLISMHS
jgi:hypothetical protein